MIKPTFIQIFSRLFFSVTVLAQLVFASPVSELITELKAQDSVVVQKAIVKLGVLGPQASSAVTELVELFKKGVPPRCYKRECVGIDLRPQIIDTFIKIGPKAVLGLPLMLEIVQKNYDNKNNDDLCKLALKAIAVIGREPVEKNTVKILADFLKGKDGTFAHELVLEAIKTIGAFDKSGQLAVPVLISFTKNTFSDLQTQALRGLIQIDLNRLEIIEVLTAKINTAEGCCSKHIVEISIPYFKSIAKWTPKELDLIDRSLFTLLKTGEKNGQIVNEAPYLTAYRNIFTNQPSGIRDSTIEAMANTFAKLPSTGNSSGIMDLIQLAIVLKSRAQPMIPALQSKIADSFFSTPGYRSAAIHAVEMIDPIQKAQVIQACRRYMDASICQ